MENGKSDNGFRNNYYSCLSSSPNTSGRRSPAELENNLSNEKSILYNRPKITSYKDITKINTIPMKVEKKRVNLIPALKRIKQEDETMIDIDDDYNDSYSDEKDDIYHSSDDEFNDDYNNDMAFSGNYESSFISQDNYSNNYYSRTYKSCKRNHYINKGYTNNNYSSNNYSNNNYPSNTNEYTSINIY